MSTCPFIHDNIDTLYGVPVMAIEDLPTVCTCGATLTYEDEVAFVEVGQIKSVPGLIEVTEGPLFEKMEAVTSEVFGDAQIKNKKTADEMYEMYNNQKLMPDVWWMTQESWDDFVGACEALMPDDPVIMESTPYTDEELKGMNFRGDPHKVYPEKKDD